MKKVFTLQEIAKYLKVHPRTVYRMTKAKKIKYFRVGSLFRFYDDCLKGMK